MDSEPYSSSKDEDDEDDKIDNNNKQASSSSPSYNMSMRSASRYFRSAQLFGVAVAALVLIVIMMLLIKYSGFLHHEFAVNHPDFDALNPSKLLEEVLLNKNVYLSQLANQDWWNLFMNELNITSAVPVPPLRMPQIQKKRRPPGIELAQKGAKAKYPIIMLPGFVTSGLEYWSSGSSEGGCGRQYHFRQRLWTAVGSAKSFLGDRECWRQHMMLHPFTGSDPDPYIRLRAATGFDAVDYFLGNYWVFGKILENLAHVGYDPSNMAVEPYDWRLAFPVLEERDGYLTKLRYKIESMHVVSGRKVVLTSHSMGALLVTYFFKWVTTDTRLGGGGGGTDWVNQHIQAYVNIAGPHLGVAKAATALLSGEMSETIFPQPMGSMVEQFFGRSLRRGLWSSWGSLWSMLPRGGDSLWGIGADLNCLDDSDEDIVKDDPFCPRSTGSDDEKVREKLSPVVVMTDDVPVFNGDGDDVSYYNNNQKVNDDIDNLSPAEMVCEDNGINAAVYDLVSRQQHSIKDILDYLRSYGGGYGTSFSSVQLHSLYRGDDDNDGDEAKNKHDPSRDRKRKKKRDEVIPKKSWYDPIQTPLPFAPNLRIYCLYGVGVPTERAYYYKRNHNETVTGTAQTSFLDPPIILDSTINDPDQSVKQGVRYVDGDGSVPLLSLGYLCTDAWQRPNSGLNPSNAPVITREYQHRTEFVVDDPMRGGPNSADHVDVLGNVEMMTDLLRVATDFEMDQVNQNQIVSDIERITQEINRHPKGGIYGVGQRVKKRKWFGLYRRLEFNSE